MKRYPRLYFLPEAAAVLGVPLRRLRYWVYHPLYRRCLTHATARATDHPRRHRVLGDGDLEALSQLLLLHGIRLLGTPTLRIALRKIRRRSKSVK